MTAYLTNPEAWQESWDRQQEAYLPDREQRFAAMLDAVDAVTDGAPPRLLDLAGGTGTISLRTLARFPGADVTVLDQDPALLAIARASLGTDQDARQAADNATQDTADQAAEKAAEKADQQGGKTKDPDARGNNRRVLAADLNDPRWATGHTGYDAVLTATALHWLSGERVAALYREIHGVLRDGGIFVNADHMPDDSLPGLTKRLLERAEARRAARYRAGAAYSWRDWWALPAADEFLGPLVAERRRIYPSASHNEWTPPVSWHVAALTDAGFTEAGVLWRGGTDAAVIGVR
jgi:SAM-dependent methyltransferase